MVLALQLRFPVRYRAWSVSCSSEKPDLLVYGFWPKPSLEVRRGQKPTGYQLVCLVLMCQVTVPVRLYVA
ncbi:hypothetical protein D9M70_383750 [compost metagenome]